MHGPFPLAAVIDRAKAVPGVRLAGNAADLAAAMRNPPNASPAVFVLCEERGGRGPGADGGASQQITATVKLILWVRNSGGPARVVQAMAALESAMRAAFFGWRPSAECMPLTIGASGNEQAIGSHLVRQLLMQTDYRQTEAAT